MMWSSEWTWLAGAGAVGFVIGLAVWLFFGELSPRRTRTTYRKYLGRTDKKGW